MGGILHNPCCPLVVIWMFWWETLLDQRSNFIFPVPKRIQLQPIVHHCAGESGCYAQHDTIHRTRLRQPQPKHPAGTSVDSVCF